MTFKPQKPADQPEPKPGVEVGDHLYVHHQGQPCTGLVRAHGRHGVTVEIDGQHHKVKWQHVLGHKTRVRQSYTVMDAGEDGMLVQDAQGRRRYVATPNESKEDPMVAKSMRQRPVLLFMKANGAPPGPGLQEKKITDKNGVQTTRWVSVDAGGPPAQRGQHVGFTNGAHKTHGQVIASGQHGVTVQDHTGGRHQVPHAGVTHHWQGDGAPDTSPHDAAAASADAPGKLFTEEDLAHLPDKVNQPVNTWEALVEKGTEGLAQFREQLGKVAQVMGLQTGRKPEDITPEEWENDKGFMFLAPLKGEKRAREKVEADYHGDWSQLRDVVRATISVPHLANVAQALQHLKSVGVELAQKPKDRFSKPTDEGYRDLMTIVKLPNGMLAELQIHVKAMTLAKEKGHKDYEVTRSLIAKYGEPPSDKWDDGDRQKFDAAVNAQKKLYDTVWTRETGGGDATKPSASNEKPMQKSERCSKMIMLFGRVR